MGSLMSGWDSPVSDPKSVEYRRNRSLTKGQIDKYWKSKKKIEEEHLRSISIPSNQTAEDFLRKEYERKYQRSSSMPPVDTMKGLMDYLESDSSPEKLTNQTCWWTRSNWAFLNEPPVIERSSNTYASQFHIANHANAPKANTGISAN